MSLKNKNILKVPRNTLVIFCNKKKLLTIKGPLKKKTALLQLKISISSKRNVIYVSSFPYARMSNAERKKIDSLRGAVLSQIRHLLIESSITIYKKLRIVGVGYRINFAETFLEKKILTFKLGLSHSTYMRVPNNLHAFSFSKIKFCIFGDSYYEVSSISSIIRAQKAPEPYKGKGILLENETLILKEGKKI